jgi:hypothetical protein
MRDKKPKPDPKTYRDPMERLGGSYGTFPVDEALARIKAAALAGKYRNPRTPHDDVKPTDG